MVQRPAPGPGLRPDPYAGLADDELSPIDLDDTETRDAGTRDAGTRDGSLN